MRISAGLDLADKQAFPVASFLHRLDLPLLARFHSRDGELVGWDAVPLARNITSKRRCSRHLLPFLQLRPCIFV